MLLTEMRCVLSKAGVLWGWGFLFVLETVVVVVV